MQRAEILVGARLGKGELVDEPCVIKYSSVAVRVIRRTKLPISCAGRAACNAVRVTRPRPAYGVPHTDVYHIWIKGEFTAYGTHSDVESLATGISLSARSLASVLIDDLNAVDFRPVVVARSIAGHNRRQTRNYQHPC